MQRVIVIDDDLRIREILCRAHEREGYQVEGAADGIEGLALFRRQPADLVIADIIMPNMDGLEAIQEIRKEYPDVKVIAISGGSGKPDDALLAVAKSFGAQRLFLKPFQPSEILEATRELLADQPALRLSLT